MRQKAELGDQAPKPRLIRPRTVQPACPVFGDIRKETPGQTDSLSIAFKFASVKGYAENDVGRGRFGPALLAVQIAFFAIATEPFAQSFTIEKGKEIRTQAFSIMGILPLDKRCVGVIADQQPPGMFEIGIEE